MFFRLGLAALLAAALGSAAAAGPPPADAARKARAEAIRHTLRAIDAELRAHGGTWEAWGKALDPFQEDLGRKMKGKWPWPAKKDFVFYGRSLRLVRADQVRPPSGARDPFEVIVEFDRQCKARGIDLVWMPIPDKITIYPDYLSEKAPGDRLVAVQVKRLMKALLEKDVEVIDLYTLYRDRRRALGEDTPLYYSRDGHWRNRAAGLAAEEIARRLRRYDFVRERLAEGNPYTGKPHRRTDGAKADDVTLVVRKETGGRYGDVGNSPVVLTGDSFSMYNMHLKAHLPAQVALRVGLPLTFMCREGLSSTMPVEIAAADRRKGYLKGRRVIIWTHSGRMLTLDNWAVGDMPGAPTPQTPAGTGAAVRDLAARGVVETVGPRPLKDAPYANYIMRIYMTDLAGAEGGPVGPGHGIVHVLAMRERKVLPIAAIQPGQPLEVRLTSWEAVEDRYGSIMTGVLDPRLEGRAAHYWGEPGERWTGGAETTIETRPGEDAAGRSE